MCHYLIASGANINQKQEDGWTPLHYAAFRNCFDIGKVLIECGATLSEQDRWGFTPLHRAAKLNHIEIAQLLVDSGADIQTRSKAGKTAIQVAKTFGSHAVYQCLYDEQLKAWYSFCLGRNRRVGRDSSVQLLVDDVMGLIFSFL
eukprot:c7621_g1_i1.p1 GENE.c7621_g1_i1~~c7621_g1_i1.p1  ORF type:complete len:145 (-),score=21.27 c7621_g1_i1:45-479(-)